MAAALAGLPFAIGRSLGASPNSKLRFAMVGVGSQGSANFTSALGSGLIEPVAVCDVFRCNAEKAVAAGASGAKIYSDYRKMFDELGGSLDAVLIATPDHNHYGPATLALASNIPVYLQKPLCHSFDQCNRLAVAARAAGVPTQMGAQGFSSEGVRVLKEWVDGGVLGEVTEIHGWTHKGGMEKTPTTPEKEEPITTGMDWDLWLGPAPVRPHSTRYYPAFNSNGSGSALWGFWRDFGTGRVADMGIHLLVIPHFVFQLPLPHKIEVWVSHRSLLTYPGAAQITFHFKLPNQEKPLIYHWYDGKSDRQPPVPAGWDQPKSPYDQFPDGTLVIGSKASAIVSGAGGPSARIFPETRFAELKSSLPPKTLLRIKGSHIDNWLHAVIDRSQKPTAPFEIGAHLTKICLLGSTAVRVGRSLEFDAASETFKGDTEATNLLTASGGYEPRKGFLG